jgi:hypothetical protein
MEQAVLFAERTQWRRGMIAVQVEGVRRNFTAASPAL